MSEPLLHLRHRECEPHRLRDRIHIPRVHPYRPTQRRGAPNELGDDDQALLLLPEPLPANRVFIRHQIHPVPHRIHNTALTNRVIRDLLVSRDCPINKYDWFIPRAPIPLIDPPRNRSDLLLHFLNIPSSAPRRVRNLNQNHLPSQYRTLFQQLPHRKELQADPFKQIHVIHTQKNGFSHKPLPNLPNQISRIGPRHHRFQLPHMNPNGKNLDPDRPPIVLQPHIPPLRLIIKPKHPTTTRKELLPDGDRAVDLGGGEGGVEEEPEADAVRALAEERREEHQVIIMGPDPVFIGIKNLRHLISEGLVRGDVRAPLRLLEPGPAPGRREGEHVMQERPQVVLAEAVVVGVVGLGGEEDGDTSVILQKTLRDLVLLGWIHLRLETTDVDDLGFGGEAVPQLEDERVVVPLEVPIAGIRSRGPEGELVGDDDPPLRRGGGGGISAVGFRIGGDDAGDGHDSGDVVGGPAWIGEVFAARCEVEEVHARSRRH
ncbi:hypothetical protein QJS04_geneDACA003944 [Acorus gramineus]|uniref:Uncharacterized protein n=1 Tax=Acorus gramineus TaxID=55184 RepID=A0AAV9BFD9_ACOGR|nr:hypothetical protein QJS04_geneDACA003944 [Acorus gramineus]